MAKVLVVGCGGLGSEVALILASAGHQVVGIRKSKKQLPNNLTCLQADVTDISTLSVIEGLNPNIIVYCVAANAQSDASYSAHYVKGLKNIMSMQVDNKSLQHVFFVSSTRVYGQQVDYVLRESDAALPADFGGERLLEAELFLKTLSCGTSAIRLSGIYGSGRLYLVNMAKDPTRWPKVNNWTNRIHRDDAASFISFLCGKVIAGIAVEDCYIATDDAPVLQHEVLNWLAGKLNIQVPHLQLTGVIGGKRLSNQQMHDSGFQLTYPNYQVGYCEVLKEVQCNV